MPNPMVEVIRSAYDALPRLDGSRRPIRPFIGRSFPAPDEPALRVMGIGVNANGAANHVHVPEGWASVFRDQSYPYQRRVLADLATIAHGLAGLQLTGDRPFLGAESVYLTNAVKRRLPDATRASDVEEGWFTEGTPVLDAELAALADADRLPHVLVVMGRRPWGNVWPAFTTARGAWSASYSPVDRTDPLFHHLNLVEVREAGATRPLLLLRVRHASGSHWMRGWTPARLVAHSTLRRVAGLGDNSLQGTARGRDGT
jgi:hypothetical protein